MDATFWTAFGALVTALAAAGALLVHVVRYAYRQGRLDQSVGELRDQLGEVAAANSAIAGLNAAVSALSATVDGVGKALDKLDQALSRRLDAIDLRLAQTPPASRPTQRAAASRG